MTRAVCVSGSGTGIGKTYVSSVLIRQLKAKGQAPRALKPVMSGFDPDALDESDAGQLIQALGQTLDDDTLAAMAPWRFEAALAPDMAAVREGRSLSFDEVVAFCRRQLVRRDEITLIEAVGGVMAPMAQNRLCTDFARALDLPVLLVVGSYLGTISHTLTAVAALKAEGLPLIGVVISESEDSPVPLAETQAAIVHQLRKIPVISLPRLPIARWQEQPHLTVLLSESI